MSFEVEAQNKRKQTKKKACFVLVLGFFFQRVTEKRKNSVTNNCHSGPAAARPVSKATAAISMLSADVLISLLGTTHLQNTHYSKTKWTSFFKESQLVKRILPHSFVKSCYHTRTASMSQGSFKCYHYLCSHLSSSEMTAVCEMSHFPQKKMEMLVSPSVHFPRPSLVHYLGSSFITAISYCVLSVCLLENNQDWNYSLPKQYQPMNSMNPE